MNPRDQASEHVSVDGANFPFANVCERPINNPHAISGVSENGISTTMQLMTREPRYDSQASLSINDQPNAEEQEEEIIVFIEPPNPTLFCLLCKQVFKDPIIAPCGHTFCRRCVTQSKFTICPDDLTSLSVCVTNLALQAQIGELYINCRFGVKLANDGMTHEVDPSRCPVTMKINERKAHELSCEYAYVQCPYNPHCPQMFKKDLAEHLLHCQNAVCPQHKFGCSFHGTSDEMEKHVQFCPYEKLKDFISRTEKSMSDIQQSLLQKDQEISFLRAMLGKLSEKVETMEKTVEDALEAQDNRIESISTEVSALQENIQVVLSGQIGVFDPQQIFKCKGTFVGHSGPVWCLCVHQDYLFSGSSDKTIKVWDTATSYRCLKTMEGHQGIVLALTVHGNKLYSASQDCLILVWNIETFEKVTSVMAHDNPVCTLTTAKNMLFSGSLKLIKVWDLQTMKLKHSITGLNHWVRALASSQTYLFGGSFQTVKIWDLETLEFVRQLETPGGSIYSIAITPHHILCGMYENCIHVWELNSYNQVTTLVGHNGTVYAMAVFNAPSGTKVFSASYDRSLRVWSMDNMICTQTLVRHDGSVTCLASARGQIFSGATDSTVKVWR